MTMSVVVGGLASTSSAAPATISAVGTLASASSTSLSTLSVSPQTVGDVFTVFAQRLTGSTLTSISGGGVTTWTKAVQFSGSVGADEEIWYGKITSTG
ncbi:MAG TPA: hypothetical protein VII76_07125, partial [Acidimicrobiales bacterium]